MRKLELANVNDIDEIMELFEICHDAVRKSGNPMWEDGYPNREIFLEDLKCETTYIIRDENTGKIIAYGHKPPTLEDELFFKTHNKQKTVDLLKYIGCEDGNAIGFARMMVHPGYQNQGLGRFMMQEVDKIYNHPMWVFAVMKVNEKALRHWEKEGFKNFGIYYEWEFGEYTETCDLYAGYLKNR